MPLTRTEKMIWVHAQKGGVCFFMRSDARGVHCIVSRAALKLLNGGTLPIHADQEQTFRRFRSKIEQIASYKFDQGDPEPIEVTDADLSQRS